ncbi:hypothetical protein [Vulcanisaeta sp. JCM 16161]|uniref:hypothetical protein n=1 Tax=Vulcanisaeta sp. JCM 16161 TaxID=1295372 RepID=UPI000B02C26C|nr:hypothetical protein [Vulcanisaeta sp. JCM 16161]
MLAESPSAVSARERVEVISRMPVLRTGVDGLDNAVGGLRFGASTSSRVSSGLVRR